MIVWVSAQVSLPALPRVGDEITFSNGTTLHPIEEATVEKVCWEPLQDKKNVLQAVVYLKPPCPIVPHEEWNGKETLKENVDEFIREIEKKVENGEIQFSIEKY